MFTHTTENMGDHILVKFYKKGQRGIYQKMSVAYNGDWNEVEFAIETMEEALTKIEEAKQEKEALELLSNIIHNFKDFNRGETELILKVMALENKIVHATNGSYRPDTTYNIELL